jgi:glycosyltransferase involved in cell wall biosynthesis
VIPRLYRRLRPPQPAPFISIVTPSYNQAPFLERTIRSVREQDYPRLEHIVQDGGSTDATPAVLERYAAFLTHAESAPDRGQAHALNLGFRHATGEILAYLNSDDLLLPGALAYVARYFAAHADVDAVYSHRLIIDADDREVGRWVLPPHDDDVLLWEDYVPQETLFWRRRVWERVGARLDESFEFALDWDLLVRFRQAGAKFARLPRFLAAFRVHPQQKTSARRLDLGVPETQRIRARCHGRLVTEDEVRRHVRAYLRRHLLYDKLYRLGLLAC